MSTDPAACLDANTIVDLLAAELGDAAMASARDHIDRCDECRLLVTAIAITNRAADEEPPEHETSLALPGQAIGRYIVVRLVGFGGMGVVYAARDPKLDRLVALKLFHPDSDEQQANARRRLTEESKIMARLSHANVATVYDIGEWDGQIYLALEYIGGGTLREWQNRKTRTWQQVHASFLSAGNGLAAAHAVDVVHGDFKPDNVLLTDEGEVRVCDFGLARLGGTTVVPIGDEEQTDCGRTRVGTPAYMAPEQFVGRAATPLSDQYSFCTALFEALYGFRPFAAETIEGLAAAVTGGAMRKAPSDAGVPAWLRVVLMRGLSRDPSDRFPSMTQLLAALRPRRPRRRSLLSLPLIAVALGVVAFAVVAGAALWTHTRAPTPRPNSLAFELLHRSAEVGQRAGNFGEAEKWAAVAADLAEERGRDDLELRALLVLSAARDSQYQPRSQSLTLRIARLSQQVRDPELRADALLSLSDTAESAEALEVMLEMATGAVSADDQESRDYLELLETMKNTDEAFSGGIDGIESYVDDNLRAIARHETQKEPGIDPCAAMEGAMAQGTCYSIQAMVAIDDKARATRLASRAIAIFEEALGPTHCSLQLALAIRGDALLERDAIAAERDLNRARKVCPDNSEEERGSLDLQWAKSLVALERIDDARTALSAIDPAALESGERAAWVELTDKLEERGAKRRRPAKDSRAE